MIWMYSFKCVPSVGVRWHSYYRQFLNVTEPAPYGRTYVDPDLLKKSKLVTTGTTFLACSSADH
jgi:hypothetical protein